ncbi:hypothetical protein B0H13DRAFT_1875488 [Mycena leptocephala]|nr:hypothetical protein B0H13DRAFT_1875488 [Mycena leptocephala]
MSIPSNPPPTDPAWRKNGHQLKDVPPAVQAHIRIQTTMSPLIRSLYLPHPQLSMATLAKYRLPPMVSTPTHYKIPSGHTFFSEDASHSELDLLAAEITVPPPSLIAQLASENRQRYLDGAESICIPWTGQKFPHWVTDKPNVDSWRQGLDWLMKLKPEHPKEVKDALQSLSTLAWSGSIPLEEMGSLPRSVGDPVESLAIFLSRKWFSSRQVDQMLDLFLYDIKKATPERKIEGISTSITTEILVQYSKSPRDYNPNADHFLQRFGRSLQNDSEFAGVFHVYQNHWVSACVDVMGQSIENGDPGGGSTEEVDVCAALEWFVVQHVPKVGNLEQIELRCTQQRNTHNCGLYAPNSIAHKYLPDEYPLIDADLKLGDLGRVETLRRIISKFHDSKVPSRGSDGQLTKCTPFWLILSLN